MPATARRPEEGIRPPAAIASPLSPLPPRAQALSLPLFLLPACTLKPELAGHRLAPPLGASPTSSELAPSSTSPPPSSPLKESPREAPNRRRRCRVPRSLAPPLVDVADASGRPHLIRVLLCAEVSSRFRWESPHAHQRAGAPPRFGRRRLATVDPRPFTG
jgi:hypothetical protein